jgi:fatty acid-binding protein DegV
MGLGLIVIAAAESARAGKSLQEIKDELKEIISNMKLLATFDHLKYMAKSGRMEKRVHGRSFVKRTTAVVLKEGEFSPYGQVRSRSKAIDHC